MRNPINAVLQHKLRVQVERLLDASYSVYAQSLPEGEVAMAKEEFLERIKERLE